MKKYFSLVGAILKASFIADIQYRTNVVLQIIADIFWYSAQISVFEVLYHHTNSIAGWDLASSRVFLGTFFLVDSIWMVFFSECFNQFSENVRQGDLDLILVRPVNSQFMVSTKKMNTVYFFNSILALLFLIWSLKQIPTVPFYRLFWLLIAVPCGVILQYTIRFFFTCLSVIFINADSLEFLWFSFLRFGLRPDNIYPPLLRCFVIFIIPVAFYGSIPAKFVLGKAELWSYLIIVPLTLIFLLLSHYLWKFTLKFYSSASS